MSNAISSSDVSAVSALISQLPPGEPTALDPSNPVHRAAIEAALAAANRSPDRYPALHARLAKGASAGGDTLTLVDKGKDRSGRATATTWHAAGADPLYAGGALFALDGDGGDLLALGHNSNVGEGFVPVSTDTPTAKPAGKALKVLSVNHSVSRSGEARFTAVAGSATLAEEDEDAGIVVNAPTQTPRTPPNDIIAVGRTTIGTDADYYYYEPQNLQLPYLIVPFVGNAVLPYDIQGTLGQPVAGAVLTTLIYFTSGGVTQTIAMNPTYTQNFAGKVTINSSDQSLLEWDYAYDSGSYTNTQSIVYNQQSLVNETDSYFFYSFEIPVTGSPTPTYSFAVCSNNTPNEPSYQCFKVPNITFWWHCLAAGTRVTLADGGEAAIETVTNAHRVKTGGGDLAVEATSRGEHQASASDSGRNAAYRLVVDGGHELVATGQHPVVTPSGLVPMSDLSAGDTVRTLDGEAKVQSCRPVDADGMFYNLKLGDESDRAKGLKQGAICTFAANGILVGDHLAMKAQQRMLARDVDYMSSRISPDLVADYASAVADIRY